MRKKINYIAVSLTVLVFDRFFRSSFIVLLGFEHFVA